MRLFDFCFFGVTESFLKDEYKKIESLEKQAFEVMRRREQQLIDLIEIEEREYQLVALDRLKNREKIKKYDFSLSE